MIDIAKKNDEIKLTKIAGTGTDEVISYIKSHSFVDYLGLYNT